MSQADVNQSLEVLHAELSQLDTPDTVVKDRLLKLIEDVEKQLENPEDSAHKQTNLQTLPTLIEQFESDHPNVTRALSKLLNTLSGMGI